MSDSPTAMLFRSDPARDVHRFYSLDVQRDLFGAWCFVREWGRIGSAGRVRAVPFASEPEARHALERQRRRKERRGYSVGLIRSGKSVLC